MGGIVAQMGAAALAGKVHLFLPFGGSGMLGKVTKVNDSYVTVEVSELADKPVEVIMQKSSVSTVLPKGTIKAL